MAKSRTQAIISPLLIFLFPIAFLLHSPGGEMTVAPMEKAEQEALYLAIQGFVGNWWNGSDLYSDPCGWTPIQGVSCDLFNEVWYITILNIGPLLENSLDCSQNASFTPSLFNLKHLKTLSFFNCFSATQLTTLPSTGWQKLAQSLETLEFRSNEGLVGELPVEIVQLTKLQSLVVIGNGLAGRLPLEIGNLINLKSLSLSENQFSGPIPNSLGRNMNQLLVLDLSSNSLSGSIPSPIGRLTSLLKLDLSNNLLNGSLPIELGGLQSLTLLDLRNNSLSGGWARSLQSMASLQYVLLSNNPLGGKLVEFDWKKLQNLSNLDLSNTSLTGTIPDSIIGLSKLRFLGLANNHLTGNVSPKLGNLPDLYALYLNGNNLSGRIEFSDEFFERMGRRFSTSNNRDLCYQAGGFVPYGVEMCREKGVAAANSEDEVGGGSSLRDSGFTVSFGFQISLSWWKCSVIFVQEIMLIFLLSLQI